MSLVRQRGCRQSGKDDLRRAWRRCSDGVLILRKAGPPYPVAESCRMIVRPSAAAKTTDNGICIVGSNEYVEKKSVCGLTPLAFCKLAL